MILGAGKGDNSKYSLDFMTAHAGASNTLLVIEVPESGVHWMDSRDLTIEQIIERIRNHRHGGHPGRVNVAFCDGHVGSIRDDIPLDVLRDLADPARSNGMDEEQYNKYFVH
jgi:prepilin-type processing-associated H-X9-DG protein